MGVFYVRTNVHTIIEAKNMLENKENKTDRLNLRVKPTSTDKINKIRALYGKMSQADLIEHLVDKAYAEHQKNGKIKD